MPGSRNVMVYLPVDLYDKLVILCEKEYRSMSNLIVVALRKYVKSSEGGEK